MFSIKLWHLVIVLIINKWFDLIWYGLLLVSYTNFVCKTHHFWDNWLQRCRDLENRVRYPSRSLKTLSFDRTHDFLLTFNSKYGSISCRFWDILCWKISRPWNHGDGSVIVIESGTIRCTGYGFLVVFYSNFVPKKYSTSKMSWLWKPG